MVVIPINNTAFPSLIGAGSLLDVHFLLVEIQAGGGGGGGGAPDNA